nr:MAG TPA: hypothetical protein [Caudoviricetes sp.]
MSKSFRPYLNWCGLFYFNRLDFDTVIYSGIWRTYTYWNTATHYTKRTI